TASRIARTTTIVAMITTTTDIDDRRIITVLIAVERCRSPAADRATAGSEVRRQVGRHVRPHSCRPVARKWLVAKVTNLGDRPSFVGNLRLPGEIPYQPEAEDRLEWHVTSSSAL